MKKILVTGYNSYIGNSFIEWMQLSNSDFLISKISLKNNSWVTTSFKEFDIVIHLAAIVHKNLIKKEAYYLINRDLTVRLAKKAKIDGVKHFIFLSTMGVYGKNKGPINLNTTPQPMSHYGKSKLEAENLLLSLEENFFRISIIRAPLVYGKNSKGNFEKLVRIASFIPVYPAIFNKRSAIYINNLSEFIKLVIINRIFGVLFPQNREYINTISLIKIIRIFHQNKTVYLRILNPIIYLLSFFSKNLDKAFSSLYYEFEMPGNPISLQYQTSTFEDSVINSIR
jgi:UDP-glucose 4-epimerase